MEKSNEVVNVVNIDLIMDMLDWRQPPETQARARALARNVRCINVFLQPGHPGHVKNVWDNCALILSERSDEELEPYLYHLFRWLQDINWPGAEYIFARLMRYERNDFFAYILEECIKEATALNDELWLTSLSEF